MSTLAKYFQRSGHLAAEMHFLAQCRMDLAFREHYDRPVELKRLFFFPWKRYLVISRKEDYGKIHPTRCPHASKFSESEHFSLIIDTQIFRDFGFGAAPFRDYTPGDRERMIAFHEEGVRAFPDEIIDLMVKSVLDGSEQSLERLRIEVFKVVARRWGIDEEYGYEKIRGLFEELLRIRGKSALGQALRWPQYIFTRNRILKYIAGNFDILHSVSGMYKHQPRIVNALRGVAPNYPKTENEFFINVYPLVVSRLIYITNQSTNLNGLLPEETQKGTYIYVDMREVVRNSQESKQTFGLDGICGATGFFQNTVQRVLDKLNQ